MFLEIDAPGGPKLWAYFRRDQAKPLLAEDGARKLGRITLTRLDHSKPIQPHYLLDR